MLVETGSLDGGDLYRDQGGASDTGTLLDGDDTVGPARLRRIRRASNQLQLFDAPDTTDLGAQFDTGGPAVAGRVHLKTATEEEVFEVADVTPSGQSGNRIRFGSLPTAFVDLLNGRVTGDRFILAISNLDIITRAGDAEAVEGTGALGEAAGTVGAADTRTGDAEAIEGTGELGEAEGAVGEAATRTGDAETIEATGSLGEATGAAGAAPARTGDAEAIEGTGELGEATGTAASAGERTGDAEAIEGTGELGEAEGAVGEAATRTGDAEAIEATGALGEAAGTSTAPGERTGDAGAIEAEGSLGEATGAVGAAPARTGDAEAVEGVGSNSGRRREPRRPPLIRSSSLTPTMPGLRLTAKALLVASDDAAAGNFFYEDADRGGTDTPLDGELGLGDDDTLISGIRRRTQTLLQLNDDNNPVALDIGAYFSTGGAGSDLTIYLQTLAGEVSFPAAATFSRVDQVRFTLPAAAQTLLDNLADGDRWIFKTARLETVMQAGDAEAIEGTGALGEATGQATPAGARTGDAEAIEAAGSLGEATGAAGAAAARTGDAEAIAATGELGEATGAATTVVNRTGDAEAIEATGSLSEATGEAIGEVASRPIPPPPGIRSRLLPFRAAQPHRSSRRGPPLVPDPTWAPRRQDRAVPRSLRLLLVYQRGASDRGPAGCGAPGDDQRAPDLPRR